MMKKAKSLKLPFKKAFDVQVDRRAELINQEELYELLSYSPAHELLIRRQECACLDAILRKERERHAEKKKEFEGRWLAASGKLQAVDTTIASISKIYTDSKYEIEHHIGLAAHLTELVTEKKRLVERLLREKHFLQEVKRDVKDRLSQFVCVKAYLNKVVEESQGEFAGIQQLIDRANILIETREKLAAKNERMTDRKTKREAAFASHNAMTEMSEILLNNYVAEVTDGLGEAKERCHQLEAEVANVKSTAHKRTMDFATMKIGTFNLFSQICETLNHTPNIRTQDLVGQLDYVKWTLIEINKIRSTIHDLLKKEKVAEERAQAQKRNTVQNRWRKAVEVKVHEKDVRRKIFKLPPLPTTTADRRITHMTSVVEGVMDSQHQVLPTRKTFDSKGAKRPTKE